MLPLDDDRWKQLTTFFGESKNLPSNIRDWLKSIGSEQEEIVYLNDLAELFLHQATITNAAFAVVPWLLHVCQEGVTKYQVEYLTDIALVEANRLKYGLYYKQEGTEEFPDWLMLIYHQAIAKARDIVDKIIESEENEGRKHGLVAMKPALFGDAELAWSQW